MINAGIPFSKQLYSGWLRQGVIIVFIFPSPLTFLLAKVRIIWEIRQPWY
jgi:hypothetical protein